MDSDTGKDEKPQTSKNEDLETEKLEKLFYILMLLYLFHHIFRLKADLQRALNEKDEGNAFFKDKIYMKAVRKYHNALMIAKGIKVLKYKFL